MIGNAKGHKRWLPCRAWDFESLMYPCVFFSKLFGYFPYTYKNEEYAISKPKLVLAAFVACFHLSFQTYTLYSVNFSSPYDNILETTPENFFTVLDGSIPTLMFLTSYSRSFMFKRVSRVSRILSPQDFRDLAKFLHTVQILNVIFECTYLPIYYANRQNIVLLRRAVTLLIAVASTVGLFFHLYCVCVLGACFRKVNESLQRLKEPSTNRESEFTEGHNLSRRQGIMLLMKVKYYEDVHEEISDAVDQLNKSSLSMNICFTACTFVLVTFDIYMAMEWLSRRIPLLFYSFCEDISYGVFRLMQFVMLVWICEVSMSSATEINTTIHDLANNCKDDAVKREVIGMEKKTISYVLFMVSMDQLAVKNIFSHVLKYFALQVVHRDNGITTTAFKMNGKLLSQVLSGIFMYIMILYQFSMGCVDD